MGLERRVLSGLARAHPRALFVVTSAAQGPRHLAQVVPAKGPTEVPTFRRLPLRDPAPQTRLARLDALHVRRLGSPRAIQRACARAFDVHSLHEDFLRFCDLALARLRETHGAMADDALCALLCRSLVSRDASTPILAEIHARYDVTPREATPHDVEVALDPSLLGILLETRTLETGQRKPTGTYYTPRQVAHFMCREALGAYLGGVAGMLLSFPPADALDERAERELQGLVSASEASRLKDALLLCRVCDPAVGSGVFLVAMLHEMACLLALLDRRQGGAAVLEEPEYRLLAKRRLLALLHGADVQAAAVTRTQHRLWLSLAAELPPRAPPHTLPPATSLESIVCGDALLCDPFAQQRFHVVVGNPPYLFGEHLRTQRAALALRFALARGQFDAYWLFYERDLKDLLLPGGVHCFLNSDAMLARDKTLTLRRFVLARSSALLVSHVGPVFGRVGVSAVVFLSVAGEGAPEHYTLVDYDPGTQAFGPRSLRDLGSVLCDPKHRFALSEVHELRARRSLRDYFSITRGEELGKKHLPKQVGDGTVGGVPILAGGDICRHRQPRPTHFVSGDQIRKSREIYLSPKIVVVKTGARFVAAVDDDSLVTLQSVYNLRPRGGLSCAVGCALLNSAALDLHLRAKITGQKKLFPQVTQDNVLEMPVPEFSAENLATMEEAMRTLRTDLDPCGRQEAEATLDRIITSAFQSGDA